MNSNKVRLGSQVPNGLSLPLTINLLQRPWLWKELHDTPISLSPSINTHWLTGCSVQNHVVWLSEHQVSMQPARQESVLFILVPSGLWKREEISAPPASEPKDVKVGPVSVKAVESKGGPCSFSRKVCKRRCILRGSGFLAGLNFMLFWGRWECSSATGLGEQIILI